MKSTLVRVGLVALLLGATAYQSGCHRIIKDYEDEQSDTSGGEELPPPDGEPRCCPFAAGPCTGDGCPCNVNNCWQPVYVGDEPTCPAIPNNQEAPGQLMYCEACAGVGGNECSGDMVTWGGANGGIACYGKAVHFDGTQCTTDLSPACEDCSGADTTAGD